MRRFIVFYCLLFVSVSLSATAIYGEKKTRLSEGWEFVRQELSGIDDVIESERAANMSSKPSWQKVCLPHCFNSDDAVAPDVPYYKGIGWYRITLPIDNPYRDGCLLLDFQGFLHTLTPHESYSLRQPKGCRPKRQYPERELLCLPIVLDRETDGAYLRTFVAGAP